MRLLCGLFRDYGVIIQQLDACSAKTRQGSFLLFGYLSTNHLTPVTKTTGRWSFSLPISKTRQLQRPATVLQKRQLYSYDDVQLSSKCSSLSSMSHRNGLTAVFSTGDSCAVAVRTKSTVTSRLLSCLLCQYRSYSKKRKDYKFPQLQAEDLEEAFVRGSGPGGQAVNQTANCVVLKHKPSGIVVKCHETRSLEENRKRARMRLEEKLDEELYGDQSYLGQLRVSASENKQEMRRRAHRRLAMKKAFKEREGLE